MKIEIAAKNSEINDDRKKKADLDKQIDEKLRGSINF